MDIIELKAPSPEYAADIWQFRQEISGEGCWKQGSSPQAAGELEICTSAEEWIERMKLGESGGKLQGWQGAVPYVSGSPESG